MPLHLSATEPWHCSDVSPVTTPKTSTLLWKFHQNPAEQHQNHHKMMADNDVLKIIGIIFGICTNVQCIYIYTMSRSIFGSPLISLSHNQMNQIRNILRNPSFLIKSRIFPRWLTDLGDPSMLQSWDSGVVKSPGPSPKSWSNLSCFGQNDAKNDLKGHGKQSRNSRNHKCSEYLLKHFQQP